MCLCKNTEFLGESYSYLPNASLMRSWGKSKQKSMALSKESRSFEIFMTFEVKTFLSSLSFFFTTRI
jgi:hypothetical protein